MRDLFFVRVYTHSACRPSEESSNVKEKGSGITIRDVRFAVLLERLVDSTQGSNEIISRLNPKVLSRPTHVRLLRHLRSSRANLTI